MDPLGFGLENFDGIGAWRTVMPNGMAVDSAGNLPITGTPFTGAPALAKYLDESETYKKGATKYLITYAVGRVLADQDECNVESVAKKKQVLQELSIRSRTSYAATFSAKFRGKIWVSSKCHEEVLSKREV